MSEKELNHPAADEAVDAILAEVLGKEGSHLVKRYSAEGESVPLRRIKEEPVEQQPQTPPVAAPKNTVPAPETSPEMIEADYRSAAAKYEVNGYRFSAPQAPAYAPYPAYPAYPAYPQPVAYVPYPAYPTYPAYPQPYGYSPYPTGYEGYGEYQPEQPMPASEQQAQPNAYAAAAGSRVVYDADWAEPGRQTAPPQQPQAPQAGVPVMQAAPNEKPHINPAFIDPLSSYDDDETVPAPYTDTVSFADRHKAKNPQAAQAKQGTDFFPAGFSATKNKTVAANGKTTPAFAAATDPEAVFAEFSEDYEKTESRRQEWLLTDEELQEVRDQRRKETEKALQETAMDIEEYDATADSAAQEAEALQKAEAQQIIAEHFSHSADRQPLYSPVKPSANASPEQPDEQNTDQYMDHCDDLRPDPFNDSDYDSDYDNDYKGVSELYYNNPNEPEKIEKTEVKTKKKENAFAAFIRRNTPHKGQTKREFISCLIMDLAFVVLIGGLIFCAVYFSNYNKTKEDELEIQTNIYEEDLASKITDVQLAQLWADLKAAYPDIDYPDNLNPDFAKLYTVNQDVAGWLEVEGADMSTVILQADDNDYYLYRDLYKESTKYGTPFVDYRNSMDSTTLSRNTIIYGHNTHDGLKFHNLTRYLELSGYKAAPIVKLNTLFSGLTYWKVFAVTLSDSTTDEFEYLYDTFSSEDSFLDFIDDIRAHSMYDIDVDVKEGDNILTLYTCYQNLFENGRLTVFARQVRAGEDLNVNTANASVNSDCLYPDAYYGITYENSTYTSDSDSGYSDYSYYEEEDDDTTTANSGNGAVSFGGSDDEYDYEYSNGSDSAQGEDSLG